MSERVSFEPARRVSRTSGALRRGAQHRSPTASRRPPGSAPDEYYRPSAAAARPQSVGLSDLQPGDNDFCFHFAVARDRRRPVVRAGPLRVVRAIAHEAAAVLAQVPLEIAALQAIVSVSDSLS